MSNIVECEKESGVAGIDNFCFAPDVLEELNEAKYILFERKKPNTAMGIVGRSMELLLNHMSWRECVSWNFGERFNDKIIRLTNKGLLPEDISNKLHTIRKTRNKASHLLDVSFSECDHCLKNGYEIIEWCNQQYSK